MELINDLAANLKIKLKKPEGNPSDLVALRTAIQVLRPEIDQLSDAVLPIAQKHFHEFKGTFLDVGCYGGWMYPHVRHLVDYHGIDNWHSGIECAVKLFGDRFEEVDMFQYQKKHDVVWCSQLLFGRADAGWEQCKSLANKLCIYVSPEANQELPGMTEFYQHIRMGVAIWRNPEADGPRLP